MRKLFPFILSMLLVLTFSGCSSESESQNANESESQSESFVTYSDLTYGEEPDQNMDIILPAEEHANGGVLLLIHGGAWVEGDKSNGYTDAFMNRYQESGYITATMNYRFTSESITIDDMLDDITSALNFIKTLSDQNGIPANKAMLIGWSSGGHMAELYSYSMADASDIEVTCVTAYSGIADLTDKDLFIDNPLDEILNRPMTDVVSCLCGYTFDASSISDAETYLEKASPIFYADTAVPTIICHSEIDTYVNYQTAQDLKAALDQYQIDNCFIDFPNSGHDLLLDPDSLTLSYEKIDEYAQKYLT
ncbi:MAG: alpha/beta hydrolase fold domain-containing protein [Ruminococcus sp.]